MNNKFSLPGIPDDEFFRETGVPMTKYEIRVLSISLLKLFPGVVMYDIGAGTGSIALEAKLAVPDAAIFAIEKNPQAIQVIEKNCRHFGADLNIVEGTAPIAMEHLPPADRVFLGGSGGDLEDMLFALDKKLKRGGRLVINTVTMHSAAQAYSILEKHNYQLEARQINVARSIKQGKSVMWQASNPVTIISGTKRGA